MSEIIKGTISKIFYPKNGMYFEDIEYSGIGIKLENGDFVLANGDSFPLFTGLKVILTGEFVKSGKRETFKFTDIERDLSSKSSMDDLLAIICGSGTAALLIRHFNSSSEVLRIIRENPEQLLKIKGIKEKTVQRITENYNKNMRIQEVYNDLKDYGFSIRDTVKIIKKIGDIAIEEIKKNPYLLFKKNIFKFKECDLIAERNNFDMNSLVRKETALFAAMKDNFFEGHTYMLKEDLIEKTIQLLTIPNYTFDREEINKIFQKMVEKGYLIQNGNIVHTKKSWNEENDIRMFVEEKKNQKTLFEVSDEDIEEYEKLKGFKLGKEQKEAVINSAKSFISVITGGPGTGKTTILDCLMTILKKKINAHYIGLCSPTGKAARRMTESTKMPAFTIHKFLEVDPTDSDLERFIYNKENKLPHKLVVIDEASMIDQFIGASLIRALKDDAQVIFVGDIEQLPPVGAGHFLRDLIDAGVKVSKLVDVYRQAGDSSIIKLSQQIRSENVKDYKSNGTDFGFINKVSKDAIIETFLRGAEAVGVENIVILTPQNTKELGTKALSNEIVERLLPDAKSYVKNKWIFKEGARIMQTRNNNENGIVNGQMGFIREIDFENKEVIIEFDGIDEPMTYNSELMDHIVLGYAITIHKSQGSEWKYVIQIVAKEHYMMNTKPLVYTGITRAKEKLIIFADEKTFLNAPKRKNKRINSKITLIPKDA